MANEPTSLSEFISRVKELKEESKRRLSTQIKDLESSLSVEDIVQRIKQIPPERYLRTEYIEKGECTGHHYVLLGDDELLFDLPASIFPKDGPEAPCLLCIGGYYWPIELKISGHKLDDLYRYLEENAIHMQRSQIEI